MFIQFRKWISLLLFDPRYFPKGKLRYCIGWLNYHIAQKMMAVHSSVKSSCKWGKYFKLEWFTCMEASMRSKGFWMHSSHKFSNDAAAELALDWLCRVKLPKGPETSEKWNISVKIGLQNNKNESTLIFQIQHIWVNLGYTRWHWTITDWNAEKYLKIVRAKANYEKYSFLFSTIFVGHIFRPIFSLVVKYFRRCSSTLMHCTDYWFNLLTHFKWDSILTRAGTIIELLILQKNY